MSIIDLSLDLKDQFSMDQPRITYGTNILIAQMVDNLGLILYFLVNAARTGFWGHGSHTMSCRIDAVCGTHC